jgi:hypothetical protein
LAIAQSFHETKWYLVTDTGAAPAQPDVNERTVQFSEPHEIIATMLDLVE